MEEERGKLYDIKDVRNLQAKFYSLDQTPPYKQDILTLFHHNLRGDCDDATVLGIWALENINIPSREIILVESKTRESHSMAVSNDNRYMISNNMINVLGERWQRDIFRRAFYAKYDYIVDGGKIYNK